MDEKELLRKAFEYGEMPGIITYCFTELCPMKNNCIHYLASLYKNDDTKRGHAIFPNALKDGKCEFFAPLRIVKMAWGFDKLFAEVKLKDAPQLRSEMRSYLGSKGQYYRYKLGQLKLVPEQGTHQATLRSLRLQGCGFRVLRRGNRLHEYMMKNPATHGFSVPTTCSLTDRWTGID